MLLYTYNFGNRSIYPNVENYNVAIRMPNINYKLCLYIRNDEVVINNTKRIKFLFY